VKVEFTVEDTEVRTYLAPIEFVIDEPLRVGCFAVLDDTLLTKVTLE